MGWGRRNTIWWEAELAILWAGWPYGQLGTGQALWPNTSTSPCYISLFSDTKYFLSQSKNFIYADLLEVPEEKILHRDTSDGGLGLFHITSRAKAALTATFLQTATNPNFQRDHYHNSLYRHYVLEEDIPAPAIPPHFRGDFFSIIRDMRREMGAVDNLTFRHIYKFLQNSLLFGEPDVNGEKTLIPLKCEAASPHTDWKRTWRLARLKGLGPELSTFLLKLTWGILPSKARLAKILPKTYKSPTCQLCPPTATRVPETLERTLSNCTANNTLPQLLLTLLCSYTPNGVIKNFWSIELNDLWSKEICRPKTIVWSGARARLNYTKLFSGVA